MLQKIRDKITGWFAGVFLVAIAIVFIFWGIQFEGSVTTAAAKVNGEEIPAQTVLQAWQNRQSELQQTLRDELPPQLVREEQSRLVDAYIERELLAQRAREAGYRISDRQMVETLAQIPSLQVDGRFSRDRYAALLRQQGRSEAQFEREFRRDLEVSQLRNAIALSAFVTPGEMKRRLELEGETRDVAFALVPAAKFAGDADPTPEQVREYYDANRSAFLTDETVTLQYVQLDLADIAGEIQVDENELRRYYEANAARNEVPERRRASHILVESGSDDAAARKEAEELARRARAGEDFAQLARAHSDDPGSKAAGGDLGWATREAYVKEFADALFAMQQPGEIAGPVRSQFGYHVILLEEVEQPQVRSFEEARAELEPEFRREQALNIFYERSQALADESFAALNELAPVAEKLGLPLRTIQGYSRRGGGPFGNDRRIVQAAFSDEVLVERQNSQSLQVDEQSVVVLRVADHQPALERPLEEVRGEIVARLREDRAREAAAEAAKALARRVEAGESLATAAGTEGLQASTVPALTRTGPSNPTSTPLAPEMLRAFFQVRRPAADGKPVAGTATLANGDQVVFEVTAARAGNAEAQLLASPDRVPRAAAEAAAVEFDAYLADLMAKAKIQRNDRLFSVEP
jgi:peptidyl-prolyl cis-trans isomerase D